MSPSRCWNWVFLLSLVTIFFDGVSAFSVYFPMSRVNITLPDLDGIPRPLPPLLRLQAFQNRNGTVRYEIRKTAAEEIFRIHKNEILLNENSVIPRGNQRLRLEVRGILRESASESLTIDVNFTDRKCDDLTQEMCFWTDGKFVLRRGQTPTQIVFLSSEFLSSVCRNNSVAYQVLGAGGYFHAHRMTNTNTNSWILSLTKTVERESFVRGDVKCSITTENGLIKMYTQHMELSVVDEKSSFDRQVINTFASGDLRPMSFVVDGGTIRRNTPIRYPESVKISRLAAFASRVVEPIVNLKEEENALIGEKRTNNVDPEVKFTVEPDEIFSITESGGIVYVYNSARLRNLTSLRIRVSWTHSTGFMATSDISINVTDPAVSVCSGRSSEEKNKKSCSLRTSEDDCLKTCGISTGVLRKSETNFFSGGCQWRNNDKPESLSVSYRTCSPDLRTCPDRICDPLEKLFANICPQDCADYVYGSANKDISTPGISSAAGVCSCSSENGHQSCTCNLLDAKKRQGKGRKIHEVDKASVPPLLRSNDVNVSVVQADSAEQCGMTCLALILGGLAVIICGTSTFLFFLWHRRLKKRCPNQDPLKEDMININYEEYIDRSTEGLRVTPLNSALHDKPDYYDKKWEFPRYRLTVEETIGEGEFGKVLKAKAEGICGVDGSSTVAVKTLKENAKESELADLISEYQLLKEVDHPNIIHLLGACTTLDGPLYIIIEYAKHGSLRNYLRRNRHFGSELQLTNKESETSYVQSITPKDILTFAWQIAKGMSYLTEMKLVHRDLAARNVLVAEGLICKISDFGLTRDIYEDDTYLKRSKGRVPVKWMALESLSDHIYTTKSDVWSYGIVLWELVTTGGTPYPGIAVQNLFHLLKSGYRMERPNNCTPQLYQIVRSCWHENPSHRPTFKALVSKLEEMLGEGKDYLDLNPRIIENKTYFREFPDETEVFHPNADDNEEGMFEWKFDFSENSLAICGCPFDRCTCSRMLRYENEIPARKLKYENEGVHGESYIQPTGEPKPINSSRPDGEIQGKVANDNCFSTSNLYIESTRKKMEDIKKI